MASSISLWHSSRYKTLILTIEPLGAFQRQVRPGRVDGGTQQQVARCATIHSAGSQLPLRVLGRYNSVAAGEDSTPLRSEIKL